MITISINVPVKNPQAHHDLVHIVITEPALEGDMITGYPLSSTSDTVTGMDAAIISPSGQVTIIDIVDRAAGALRATGSTPPRKPPRTTRLIPGGR